MKLQLTVEEILQLNAEVAVFLREPISLGLKYKLTIFGKKMSEYTAPALEEQDNIIKKLAPTTWSIEQKLEDGTVNPVFTQFKEEFGKVLGVSVELTDCPEIEVNVLDNIVSNNNYPSIYKYLLKS